MTFILDRVFALEPAVVTANQTLIGAVLLEAGTRLFGQKKSSEGAV